MYHTAMQGKRIIATVVTRPSETEIPDTILHQSYQERWIAREMYTQL